MTEEENLSIVRRFFEECWNQGKVELLPKLMAQNHIHHGPDWEAHGPAEIQKLIQDFSTAFPGARFIIEDEIAAKDKVVVRWTLRGTHLGDFYGRAPTGHKIEYTGVDIIRLTEGKIVELWVIPDRYALYQQLAGE